MAPATSNDEQLQFLISCIRFSNNGKVDFESVAKDCNIVSKGAAAKRYERFMKAHNININGASTNNTSGSQNEATPSPKKTNKGRGKAKKPTGDDNDGSKTGAPTKRKAASSNNKATGKKAKVMKDTAVASAEKLVEQRTGLVKDEEEEENGSDTDGEDGRRDVVSDDALFGQFCNADGDEGEQG